MFKQVQLHDFVRMKTDFKDSFVITSRHEPIGIWLPVERMRLMKPDEFEAYLYEVLEFLDIFKDVEENAKEGFEQYDNQK